MTAARVDRESDTTREVLIGGWEAPKPEAREGPDRAGGDGGRARTTYEAG